MSEVGKDSPAEKLRQKMAELGLKHSKRTTTTIVVREPKAKPPSK